MSPEMGATCAIFPVDFETLRYLAFTGRDDKRVELVEAYTRAQGMFHDEDADDATYSDTLELDLSDVEPSLAGPKRPQDRVPLAEADQRFREAFEADTGEKFTPADELSAESFPASDPPSVWEGEDDAAPSSTPSEGKGASAALAERKK